MKKSGLFFLIIATLSYGAVQIVDKAVLNYKVNPSAYAVSRVFISMFFLAVTLILQRKHKLSSVFKRKHLKDLIIIGIFGSGIGLLMQISGLSYTTATNMSMLLVFVAPFTSIFAFLMLQEPLSKRFISASMLMLFGVLIIYAKNSVSRFGPGDFLIIMATIGYAYSNVYAKKTMRNLPSMIVTFGRLLFGSLSLLILFPVLNFSFKTLLNAPFLVISGGVIFGIRMITYYKGMEIENASVAGTFLLFSPVVTVSLASLFLKEPLTVQTVIGFCLVFTGGLLLTKLKNNYKAAV